MSATLLIDLGNSRVKWAWLREARLGRQHAAFHAGWRAPQFARAILRTAPRSETARRAARESWLVSVASGAPERALRAGLRRLGIERVGSVRSERRAAGVTNGYRDTWRLGVDRWVAMIGARALYGAAALLVVDVGTAMTLDLLDPEGRHRGGAIAPGPRLMIESLLHGTRGIRRRAQGPAARPGSPFARHTRAAIEAGAHFAAAALIERSAHEARRVLRRPVRVVLTGGAARRLASAVQVPATLRPDLVLQGLRALQLAGDARPRARP